jgi:hypothetical protein
MQVSPAISLLREIFFAPTLANFDFFSLSPAANPIWRLLDTPCDPLHWQVETGQLLIDKRARKGLNAIAMEIVKEMNRNHEFWFRLSGGDKDTFVSFSFPTTPSSIFVQV